MIPMKPMAKVYTGIIFLFLFAPIIILLVFSFNEGNSLSVFSGFTLYWYKELFHDTNTLGALKNTLVLAVCAALISTVMGTAAAVGINKLRNKYMKAAMNTVTNIPMVNPDIITGISLMLMFVFAGRLMPPAQGVRSGPGKDRERTFFVSGAPAFACGIGGRPLSINSARKTVGES